MSEKLRFKFLFPSGVENVQGTENDREVNSEEPAPTTQELQLESGYLEVS